MTDSMRLPGMILLIACGNSLRQDDGAGLILAEALAEGWQAGGRPVHHIEVQQLVPELAPEIADEAVEQVWFADCRLAVDETDTAVQIRRLDTIDHSPAIGHQLSPEVLMLYARTLFDNRPPESQPAAWQITVPGFHFGHAETVSDACRIALDRALGQAVALTGAVVHA